MLDFFCSLDGCSMSMSYRVWPSTMATRSSSACVALISIRFMVRSSRSTRGTPGARVLESRPFPGMCGREARVLPSVAQARPEGSLFPALQHHGGPRERFFHCFEYSRPAARAPHGTCSATGALTHRAMAGFACKPLTWPPRGRWPRTMPGSREAGASGLTASSSGIKPLHCRPSLAENKPPMTDTDPARSVARAHTVKVPEDREGQRLDNFLLGQLKGAPRSLVYKLVRSGQVRVNGGRAKAERKLAGGDEVRIPPVRLGEEAERGTPAPGLLQRIEA